jgi:hypothetical protein
LRIHNDLPVAHDFILVFFLMESRRYPALRVECVRAYITPCYHTIRHHGVALPARWLFKPRQSVANAPAWLSAAVLFVALPAFWLPFHRK